MASIVENVDSDPRFLFDVSSMVKLLPTQRDIESRITIAKKAVRGGLLKILRKKDGNF